MFKNLRLDIVKHSLFLYNIVTPLRQLIGGYMPRKCNKTQKKIFLITAIVLLISTAHAQVFFDSEGGMAVDMVPKVDFKGAELSVRSFYGAQMQLGNNILLEGQFSFMTNNIFDNTFLQDIPAEFSLNKLSFSYNLVGLNYNSRITAFAGSHDGVGTDQFMRKHFGTRSFDSPLFQPQIGLEPASIIPIDGYGLEASTIFGTSTAAAFYAYYNDKFSFNQLNFDFRFVAVTNALIADIVFGASLPFDRTDSDGNEVIVIIRRADLHTALTMLIGNNPYANLYIQAGVTRIQINPDPGNEIFSLDDLHILFEPRFTIGNVNLNISAYMLPQDTVDLTPYIEHTIGGILYINAGTNFGRTKADFGSHISGGYENLLDDLTFNLSRLSLMVTPYFNLSVGAGTLEVSAPVKLLDFATPEKMVSASISYKASF